MITSCDRRIGASFRDPAGFVFSREGQVLRAVTVHGAPDYEHLMASGLGHELMRDGLLISHSENRIGSQDTTGIRYELRPEPIEVVSYPYEWCFSQLKDAALLTLEVQGRALEKGMSLKDASAFNVQFCDGRPVFIDTLSFERDHDGPWVAYEQFCRHFLAPLMLMRWVSPELGRMLCLDLNGVGLEAASRALGWTTYLRSAALLHIHLHARAIRGRAVTHPARQRSTGGHGKRELAESLSRAIEGIKAAHKGSEWSDYQEQSSHYTREAAEAKAQFVWRILDRTARGLVYDVGGNTGQFSRMAAAAGRFCVLYDADIECIERAYAHVKNANERRILPLRLDVSNPTPSLGVNLAERDGLFDRRRAGLVMALALVHHLRLRENIPFAMMAEFFSRLGNRLLIEWVGPQDEKALAMLATKRTPVAGYSLEEFLAAFSSRYRLTEQAALPGMDRKLMVFECLSLATS